MEQIQEQRANNLRSPSKTREILRKSVLLVDDSSLNLQLLVAFTEKGGYGYMIGMNGIEVVETYKAQPENLKQARYDPPPHSMPILLPGMAMLGQTAFFIPQTPMNQKNSHIDKIRVGEHMLPATTNTSTESRNQVPDIIRMPHNGPTPRTQQQRFMHLASPRGIPTTDNCRLPACDSALRPLCADQVSLVVCETEEDVAGDTSAEDRSKEFGG